MSSSFSSSSSSSILHLHPRHLSQPPSFPRFFPALSLSYCKLNLHTSLTPKLSRFGEVFARLKLDWIFFFFFGESRGLITWYFGPSEIMVFSSVMIFSRSVFYPPNPAPPELDWVRSVPAGQMWKLQKFTVEWQKMGMSLKVWMRNDGTWTLYWMLLIYGNFSSSSISSPYHLAPAFP